MSNLEKINIFVPDSIAQAINNDILLFEVFKKDKKTANTNRFLSLLIYGYYNTYMETLRKQYNVIFNELAPILPSPDTRASLSERILKLVYQSDSEIKKEKKSTKLSLKPTALTETILLQIMQSSDLVGYVSPFLCRLITDYCSKPIEERERIIFSDNYNYLENACTNHQTVTFSTTWDATRLHTVIPYKIVTGQGEMFNYLLCQETLPGSGRQVARSYRLNRISTLHNAAPDAFTPTVIARLDKMAIYGAQYSITDDEETCVYLSDVGVRLYNRIYYGRPMYSKIETVENGYVYHFQCSKDQLQFYFRRFSNGDAIVLSPKSLRDKMLSFYENGALSYKTDF